MVVSVFFDFHGFPDFWKPRERFLFLKYRASYMAEPTVVFPEPSAKLLSKTQSSSPPNCRAAHCQAAGTGVLVAKVFGAFEHGGTGRFLTPLVVLPCGACFFDDTFLHCRFSPYPFPSGWSPNFGPCCSTVTLNKYTLIAYKI